MHPLDPAIAVTEQMRKALEDEVAASQNQRKLIGALDADALIARAARRAEFNLRLATLHQSLASALRAGGDAMGLGEVTLAALAARAPLEARRLGRAFAALRTLGEALRRLDLLNHLLAERALVSVRSYLGALAPTPVAYDRRGAATSTTALITASRIV